MPFSKEVYILYIPSDETANRDLELMDILLAFGVDVVRELIWGIETLECVGQDAQPFCAEVEAAPGHRLLVSGDGLLEQAPTFGQIIEGIFIGYPIKVDADTYIEYGWAKTRFASTTAKIAIVAVDGGGFDIYLRSRIYAELLLKSFQEVHWEDPSKYIL